MLDEVRAKYGPECRAEFVKEQTLIDFFVQRGEDKVVVKKIVINTGFTFSIAIVALVDWEKPKETSYYLTCDIHSIIEWLESFASLYLQ